jgi:ribosomal protein S12 methylthiotransferase accessory factor
MGQQGELRARLPVSAHLSLDRLEDQAPVSLTEVKQRASRIVSTRTGIVSSVELVQTGPCDPSVFWARTRTADTTAMAGVRALNEGNAAALDLDLAVVKALGESVERYCAAFVDEDELRLSSLLELGEKAIHPSLWALFDGQQWSTPGFPVAPFSEETRVRWTRAFSLTKNRPVYVPASFVHIPYRPAETEARILPWQVSTGLACHTGLARAELKALLEVIERDAFMLFWHRRIRCPAIDVSRLPNAELRELMARARVHDYRTEVRLLTLDVPLPIILVTLSSREHKPYVVMGCAADCSPETALRLALEEALLSLHGITTLVEQKPRYERTIADYADIGNLMLHAWVYAVDPGLCDVMAEQLIPTQTVPFEALPRGPAGGTLGQLRWLVDRLAQINLEAVVADLTTPDIDDVGFKVIRGMVPGMQPLDVDHRHRHLGGRRLYLPAARLGIEDHRVAANLNPYPHPFP